MKKVFKVTLTILIVLGLSTNLFASGFQINEHGTKAMSMGGAFAGLANDPSAIYFNPAGITQLMGTQIIGGTTLIIPKASFTGPAPATTEYDMDTQLFTPVHLYGTHQVSDKLFLGFGLGNNYGLGTKWEDDWAGRFLAVETEVRTFFFNLVASYEIIPELSLGLGYNLAYGDVIIGRGINLGTAEGYIEMEGDAIASGFTAGIFVKPTKTISLGLSYRSQVTFDFEGDATLPNTPEPFASMLPSGAITAPLTTPENITFGVAIKASNNLTITADYQYVGWDSYDKLEVTFEDLPAGHPLRVSSSERNYENGFIARLGMEYNYSKCLDLWAGFLYDSNPVKDEYLDPTLTDSDRLGFSAGFGYNISEKFEVQAGYLLLNFLEREITNSKEDYSGLASQNPAFFAPMNGTYNSVAHLISLTLAYNF